MENFVASPPAGNTPERIQYLKESIQSNFDNYNWYGDSKYKIFIIAAQVELIGYRVIFEPTYNCPA